MRWTADLVLILLSASSAAQSLTEANSKSNSCGGNCTRSWDLYDGGWWVSHSPTASIEAATVLIIENNRTNTSRTTTIFNLPPGVTLPPTNSAGTIVTTKTLVWNSKTTTTVLTWPTGYISYQDGVSWEGTIPATNFCSTVSSGTFSRYPSLIPPAYTTPKAETYTFTIENSVTTTTSTPDPYDPLSFYLWSFQDSQESTTGLGLDCQAGPGWTLLNYETVYPDFPVYEYCTTQNLPCAASAVGTVAYLTVTSTSHEDTGPTRISDTPSSRSTSPSPTAVADNTPTTATARSKSAVSEQTTNAFLANNPAQSTILLTNIATAPFGTRPFTYVSGLISTVVTPTTNSIGQTVIVLSSSVSVSQPTSNSCSKTGMAGFIMCGLDGASSSSGGTASKASLGNSATMSGPIQVATSGSDSVREHIWIYAAVMLANILFDFNT